MTARFHIALLAALLSVAAVAQDNNTKDLNKEITLEKDFVPVEKKAVKKNTLPVVKKVSAPAKTTLSYSDWAEPTRVPNSIPTLLPYGYRTAHNFSDKRGYLKVGGGTQINFLGSAGYRVLDTEQNTLGVWVQHNSTWGGKNNSPLITGGEPRLKQKFNDNVLGVDLENNNTAGTLTMALRGHFDSFNYYGGRDEQWDDRNKQSFTEAGLRLGWQGRPVSASGSELGYHMELVFNHAGYDKTLFSGFKGARENVLNFTVGATYALTGGLLGVDIRGDYVNFDCKNDLRDWWQLADADGNGIWDWTKHNNFTLTLSPYYKWENDVLRALVGADIVLGDIRLADDTRKVHAAPRAQLDVDIAPGAGLFVDISGGATLNTLSAMAAQNRYSDPMGNYYNTFTAFDGRAGLKVGPFGGFSAQLYACYDIIKSDFDTMLPSLTGLVVADDGSVATPAIAYTEANRYAASHYLNFNTRGFGFGGELAYKWRSLVEARAAFMHSPTGDGVEPGKWYKCYTIGGLDGANTNVTFDLRVTPIRPLAVELGLHYRGGRSYLEAQLAQTAEGITYPTGRYLYQEMDDMVNLHLGASWRFDKVLTLWLRGNNLLNRKYDALVGMGAQRLGIMGGASLVF